MKLEPSATNKLRMRPVYEWVTEGTPEDFVARLNQLTSFDPAVNIQCGSTHAVLSIPIEARHTWSPILDIHVRERGERSHVHARMGPEPQVWTFFIFMYAGSAVPGVIATVLGLVQMNLGMQPWGLWAVPIVTGVWALLYLASFVGKGLGADQIHQLLGVLEANLAVDAEELA